MSAEFTARLISTEEAECAREDILAQAPPDVRTRAASCIRKDKAFQIAAADWYMRRMAAEEGLGTADEIRIGHEESGKPFLISGGERTGKHISVSHCGGYIYLCMADGPIGCDVEKIRRLPVNDGLKGFFSETDLAAIRAADRPDVLLTRIWTRREAFAKLTGIMEGLRSRSFHDREAAEKEYSVRFTEGQEKDYLYTAAQFC